jgi:predicted transcriptional regulator
MQPAPTPVKLKSVEWYVVTDDNYDEFKDKLVRRQGVSVWYAITVKDYENLSVNLEELRRYIIEQQMLLQYYEEAITENSDEINTDEAE